MVGATLALLLLNGVHSLPALDSPASLGSWRQDLHSSVLDGAHLLVRALGAAFRLMCSKLVRFFPVIVRMASILRYGVVLSSLFHYIVDI